MIIGQIKDGIVLDHITAGLGMTLYNFLGLDKLDCQVALIKNAESVRKVINESGRVKLVIQGHFHYGSDWYDGEIHYHTVKAMCLGKSNYYEIIEL